MHNTVRALRCTFLTLLLLACSSVVFGAEIHDAARDGNLARVTELLKDNPDLASSVDSNGVTPLHWAAGGGQKAVVALLLSFKADVNAKNPKNETPLHYAAYGGDTDVAELLLANKAEVNATSTTGYTPLHYAADYGNRDVVEVLLAHKADVNARTKAGETPLHLAEDWERAMESVDPKHPEVAKLLRQHGG